jgi:hypothetical protein
MIYGMNHDFSSLPIPLFFIGIVAIAIATLVLLHMPMKL